MGEVWLTIGGLLLVVLAWCYMNHWYRLIFGRPLRWPYFWAAHGAVMLHRPIPGWEQRMSDDERPERPVRRCAMCHRPLPARRWWQWPALILPPPPVCRLEDLECHRLFAERLGLPDDES